MSALDNRAVFGVDLGTCSVKMVLIDRTGGQVLKKAYRPHHGDPNDVLATLEEKWRTWGNPVVAVTALPAKRGSSFDGIYRVEPTHSLIWGVRRSLPEARNIIDVGASTLTLIELGEKGELRNFSYNNLCAAGTGSFLESQAARLGLDPLKVGMDGLNGDPPVIATRCAVFAKSDLIHRQQEGYTRLEMWSGLCKGLTETILSTLLKGRPLEGLTVLTGGVSRNPWVLHWFKARLGEHLVTVEDGHLAAALGAALAASMDGHHGKGTEVPEDWARIVLGDHRKEKVTLRPIPLKLMNSSYPEEALNEPCRDGDGNEIRVSGTADRLEGEEVEVFLGIDVGSTTTKLCMTDSEGRILLDIYRKTGGDPVLATQKLFQALMRLEREKETSFKILGCATTGSGRKLIGKIVGADEAINEISAHA
jgi:activator of 2-hydroxyglutaryl-CoA dehydratase